MHIIKLDATPSTNQYLKDIILKNQLADCTVVTTQKQTQGRGQMGTEWISEDSKNLTFSILKIFEDFNVADQVYLNCAVSLALFDALQELAVPDLKVKWPNDIMSGSQKLCGILIENILQGNRITKTIIGIGLNVNQLNFGKLENVSSLKLILDKEFDLEVLMNEIVTKLKLRLNTLNAFNGSSLKNNYEKLLFRKDKISTFLGKENTRFMGFIRGVSNEGRLIIEVEGNQLKEFGLKEVRLLY